MSWLPFKENKVYRGGRESKLNCEYTVRQILHTMALHRRTPFSPFSIFSSSSSFPQPQNRQHYRKIMAWVEDPWALSVLRQQSLKIGLFTGASPFHPHWTPSHVVPKALDCLCRRCLNDHPSPCEPFIRVHGKSKTSNIGFLLVYLSGSLKMLLQPHNLL
jgi:hypothetical protein